jgi:cation transport protein ChaC
MTMVRAMRLTEDLVRVVHREVPDTGPLQGSVQFTEADYDAYLAELLRDKPPGPVEVFSYGSLIWKPAFEPVTSARAIAMGWQRSFCLRLVRFRGTPEVPGLMMQIDRGGSCEGVMQQVNPRSEWSDLSALWRREMTNKPPSNLPRWIDVETSGRLRKALTFTANPESPLYVGRPTDDDVAARLAIACGHWGSGADYLRQTVLSLEANGIHDPYLWELQDRVAALIEARAGPVSG